MGFGEAGTSILRHDCRQWRLRMRPLGGGHRSAAVALTAAGAADGKLGFYMRRPMALVCLTDAAGMRRSNRHSQRQRNECPGKREQQQKSGGQALHVMF
jgi:hypothetical protein